jgi:O-antigen/teichoic acid export membrane protein
LKFSIINFIRSDLFKDTSILISGTTVAQLIPIIIQPFLLRFFTPEIFGAYSVYLSLVGILIVISTFRYELAITMPKKDKEAVAVLLTSVIINLLFNIFLFIVIFLFRYELLECLNLSPKFVNYLYFVPVGTFLLSFYQCINYWLIRKKQFLALSINKFIRRGFEGSSQIVYRLAIVPNGLIYGDMIGHFSNVVSGIYQSMKSGLSVKNISLTKVEYILKKYSEYPKYNIIPSLMSACSYLFPALIINKFFSAENTGYFNLSKFLLSIPLALVATSISNVLLQRISEKRNSELSVRNEIFSFLFFVLLIVIFEVLAISFFAEDIFRIFFGNKWINAGTISKILVWAFALNFITSSFSSIFIALKKIKLLSIWQVLYFISIISLIMFKELSFSSFLHFYVSIEVICCVINITLMVYILVQYERMIFRIKLN